jgi:hypothetical protein
VKAEYLYGYLLTIYPLPSPCTSFDHMLQMLKRHSEVQKLIQVLISWIQMKAYTLPKFKKCDNFNPYKHRLARRLQVAAWTIYHFLEKHRAMLIFEHPNHDRAVDMHDRCLDCLAGTTKLLHAYPGKEVIPGCHFYELCRQHLQALSRAPSAGVLRSRKASSEADLAALTVLGGVPELCKLSLLKSSANQRIDTIGAFIDKVSSAAVRQRIRSNVSSSSSQTGISVNDVTTSLQTPFHLFQYGTVSAVPRSIHFVTGTDEWITRMYQVVDSGDRIVSAWGFVTNILMEKSEGEPPSGADSDSDFLFPVKGFDN